MRSTRASVRWVGLGPIGCLGIGLLAAAWTAPAAVAARPIDGAAPRSSSELPEVIVQSSGGALGRRVVQELRTAGYDVRLTAGGSTEAIRVRLDRSTVTLGFPCGPQESLVYQAGDMANEVVVLFVLERLRAHQMRFRRDRDARCEELPTPPSGSAVSPTMAGASPTMAGASPTMAGASPTMAGASPTTAGASPTTAGASPTGSVEAAVGAPGRADRAPRVTGYVGTASDPRREVASASIHGADRPSEAKSSSATPTMSEKSPSEWAFYGFGQVGGYWPRRGFPSLVMLGGGGELDWRERWTIRVGMATSAAAGRVDNVGGRASLNVTEGDLSVGVLAHHGRWSLGIEVGAALIRTSIDAEPAPGYVGDRAVTWLGGPMVRPRIGVSGGPLRVSLDTMLGLWLPEANVRFADRTVAVLGGPSFWIGLTVGARIWETGVPTSSTAGWP